MRARTSVRAARLVLALVPAGAAPLLAQDHEHEPADPWMEDVSIGAVNALVGGLTGAVTAWLRDGDVADGFVRGAVGGGIVFAGKRLAVEGFDGAGLLGREVGAVGASVVASAGSGGGWVDEIWLPIGPLWIQASPSSPHRARLDVQQTAMLGWAATRAELDIDWSETLSSGTFVFRAPEHRLVSDGEPVAGIMSRGVVLIGPGAEDDVRRTHRHELVHVAQYDFMLRAWSRPLEAWGWSRLLGRDVPFDIGILGLLPDMIDGLGETEADVLEVR